MKTNALVQERKSKVVKLVLTGGVCGGKSSALPFLQEQLETKGGNIIAMLPELARDSFERNIDPRTGKYDGKDFQKYLIKRAIFEEASMIEMLGKATGDGCRILVCDRGIPDGQAYMTEQDYYLALKEFSLTKIQARDERYDGVYHMLTAADGAERSYRQDENRPETPAKARRNDKQIQAAWRGHPNWHLIGNEGDFQMKCQRLLEAVYTTIGQPVPLQTQQKFVVKPFSLERMGIPYTEVMIEQMYLLTSTRGAELRIRKRGTGKSFLYYRTIKHPQTNGCSTIQESFIQKPEYDALAETSRDPRRHVIRKRRQYFILCGKYMWYDHCLNPELRGFNMLEVAHTNTSGLTDPLPEKISAQIIKEVTFDQRFKNLNLSLLRHPPTLSS